MSMSISGIPGTVSPIVAGGTPRHPEALAFRQLNSALQSGDLPAARAAYGAMIKNAPDGVTWNPDSAFASLGKALVSGDMSAAQSAFQTMVDNAKSRITGQPPVSLPPETPPVAVSSTGGVAGSTLNVQA
jgi:hypothetical protein